LFGWCERDRTGKLVVRPQRGSDALPLMNDDYWELAECLVPDHETADTVQGGVVRAVLRLTAECGRNGCGNWDAYFEALADFAEERFADGTLDPQLAALARSVLGRLRDYARRPGDQTESAYETLCRTLDDPLEQAATQWCHRHPTLIPFRPTADSGLD
jgi:hypothetical protein